jgi:cytochrome c556
MIRTMLAMTVIAFGVSAVLAQGDPIVQRKAMMKANGQQNRVASDMLENKIPFNLDAAKKVFAAFVEAGEKMPALFPDTSKTGDTNSLPAVWENKADFDAKFAKFAADSKAASAATTDLDTFKAQITEVRKQCGGCHQTYRKKIS